MGKLDSICSAIDGAFYSADVGIETDYSLDALAERLSLFFNRAKFEYTDRFDEFPAFIALIDRHEVALLAPPEDGPVDDEKFEGFVLQINPKSYHADPESTKNITPLLVDALSDFGIRCSALS